MSAYRGAAILLLNVVVAVIVLNLILGAIYLAADGAAALVGGSRGDSPFRADGAPIQNGLRTEHQLRWSDYGAYVGETPAFVGEVLDDFYGLGHSGFVYQPWEQFSEAPFDGKHVHVVVDALGFPHRRTVQPTRRGDSASTVVRIFALGGSTTFGDQVADEDTWPSQLSRILNHRARERGLPVRVQVVNYGRGYFFPTQEAVLLDDLLRSGHRPGLVVFLDGVNWSESKDTPQFSPEIATSFIERQFGSPISPGDVLAELHWLPMIRFARTADGWLDRLPPGDDTTAAITPAEWKRRAHFAVRRFLHARDLERAECEIYGCRTLAFLQPNSLYGYDLNNYRMDLPREFLDQRPAVKLLYDRVRADSAYIDLSGLFGEFGAQRKAIVDDVHYSPAFNRLVAERIAAHIDLRNVPMHPAAISDSAATGPPRSTFTRSGWWVNGRRPVGGDR